MAKKKTTESKPVTIEVLDGPLNTDHQLVVTAGDKLREFLGGMSRFFERAGQIEKAAKARLDLARQLKPPTDAASDEKIQLFIRDSKDEIKVADEHWTITTAVSSLHRSMTAARNRTTGKDSKGVPIGMLDQGVAIAQKLHNDYVAAEQRRAREEEERINAKREADARLEQEALAKKLDDQALAAEAASADLSEREVTFAKSIAGGYDAGRSARLAEYKDPDARAALLLKTPKIVKAIEGYRQAENLRTQATATRERPVEVERHIERPNISRAAGMVDRSTWSGEVFDEDALVAAVLDPRTRATLGIPSDIVTINRVKINDYASSMQELINKWPGVKANKKTSTY